MRPAIFAVAVIQLSAGPAARAGIDEARLVDLTHPFDEHTIYWPTAKPFALERVAFGPTAGGYWYAANNYCAAEHGGTHMDSPVHFAEGRWTADQVPLARCIGRAIVLLRTGWGSRWGDPKRVFNTETPADTRTLHFPGFSPTPSLDHGPSVDFQAHQIFGRANIPGFENVANLEQLPATGATFIALPMKIAGGSGGPARIIAVLP